MANFNSIITKIKELKALALANTISPQYLGDLLIDLLSSIDNVFNERISLIKHPVSVKDYDSADLVLADDNENSIALFSEGHVTTSNFSSKNVLRTLDALESALAGLALEVEESAIQVESILDHVSAVETKDTAAADLILATENLLPIATFKNGHIITANFDSSKLATLENAGSFVRLRHLHWNVGNFSKGKSASSSVTAETADARKREFTRIIEREAPDIIGMCEWENLLYDSFDARSAILGRYANFQVGSCVNYVGTAIASHFDLSTYTERNLPNGYKAIESRITVNGVEIVIVECHCPWQSSDANQQARQALIGYYAALPRVIIAGDMNIYPDTESENYNFWSNYGFKMANWNPFGFIRTGYNNTSCSMYLDNCFVKGGTIVGAHAVQFTPDGLDDNDPGITTVDSWDAVNASDHFPLITDIVFNV